MNTRPCVCQGSNENCRYCAGRGYVDAGQGLPASIGQKKLNIFGSDGKRRELRPNLPCPICGIPVTKLKRHIRKQHGGIQQGSLSSSAGEFKQPENTTRENVQDRPVSPNLSRRPASPFDAKPPAASATQLGDYLRAMGVGVTCPRCLILFDDTSALGEHLGSNCSAAPSTVNSRLALTRCPDCGILIKHSCLKKHLESTCPARLSGRPGNKVVATSVKPIGHLRNPVAKKPSPGASWGEVNSRDTLDHTKGYAHPCRESGKYGSHSMHDGFDDESGPD
jgi:uncharacterized C2H2 Zn-finger protein